MKKTKTDFSVFKRDKKGNVTLDSMTILAIIIGGVIALPILFLFVDNVLGSFTDSSPFTASVQTNFDEFRNKLPTIIDYFMIFLLLGSFIFVIVASFLTNTHPIFLPIGFLLFFALLFATTFLGNFAQDYVENFGIDVEANLPITYWAAHHILEIIIVSGILIAVVLYGKNRFSGAG